MKPDPKLTTPYLPEVSSNPEQPAAYVPTRRVLDDLQAQLERGQQMAEYLSGDEGDIGMVARAFLIGGSSIWM